MRIGIISDTHDNLDKLKKAVDIFNANKVGFVFHAGDFVAPFVLSVLGKLKCDYLGVFGNNDGEKKGLKEKSGNRIKPGPLKIKRFGRTIILSHELHQVLFKKQNPDLVIFGHSHKPEINFKGKTLFINPGECGGWLTGKSTIAICELDNLTCHVLEI